MLQILITAEVSFCVKHIYNIGLHAGSDVIGYVESIRHRA